MIDCIKLRTQMIDLIRITANPKILKVIPKIDSESNNWEQKEQFNSKHLQRDFGLYLINTIESTEKIQAKRGELSIDFRIRPFDYDKYQNLLNINSLSHDLNQADKAVLFEVNKKISSMQYTKKQLTSELSLKNVD